MCFQFVFKLMYFPSPDLTVLAKRVDFKLSLALQSGWASLIDHLHASCLAKRHTNAYFKGVGVKRCK